MIKKKICLPIYLSLLFISMKITGMEQNSMLTEPLSIIKCFFSIFKNKRYSFEVAQARRELARNPEAFYAAFSEDDSHKITLFIAAGANINVLYPGMPLPPLALAAWQGNVELVDLLIKNGAHIDTQDEDGTTALIAASENNKSACIKFLLNSGCNVNCANTSGWTALLNSIAYGNILLMKYLLNNGADIHLKNELGQSALHIAAITNNSEMAKLLLRSGLYVDTLDKKEETPLHHAVYLGNYTAAKLLLIRKANPNARNHSGDTPLHKLLDRFFNYYRPESANSEAIIDLIILLNFLTNPAITNKNGKTLFQFFNKQINLDSMQEIQQPRRQKKIRNDLVFSLAQEKTINKMSGSNITAQLMMRQTGFNG